MARLYALTKYGGVYLDTDVELLRPIDGVLQYEGVCCFHDHANNVGTAFMGCVKDFLFFENFLDYYKGLHFQNDDGSLALVPNNNVLTELLVKNGLKKENRRQIVSGLTILPSEYFYPKNSITKELKITDNTYAIHHFEGSWYSDIKDCKERIRQKYKFLPEKAVNFLAYMKMRGIRAAVKAARRWIVEKKKS